MKALLSGQTRLIQRGQMDALGLDLSFPCVLCICVNSWADLLWIFFSGDVSSRKSSGQSGDDQCQTPSPITPFIVQNLAMHFSQFTITRLNTSLSVFRKGLFHAPLTSSPTSKVVLKLQLCSYKWTVCYFEFIKSFSAHCHGRPDPVNTNTCCSTVNTVICISCCLSSMTQDVPPLSSHIKRFPCRPRKQRLWRVCTHAALAPCDTWAALSSVSHFHVSSSCFLHSNTFIFLCPSTV